MTILNIAEITDWFFEPFDALKKSAIESLESGSLIFLPNLAFTLQAEEMRFLSPTFVDRKSKNISYNPSDGKVKGVLGTVSECQQIKKMLARFAQQSSVLIHTLFPHYQSALKVGRTSFRPVEVSTRKLSYRKNDQLLHVDAFPSSPNQGQRLLRVFSNVNPHGQDRVWRLGEPFEAVANRFLPLIPKPWPGSSRLLHLLKITKSKRSEYDHIMLQIHNRMKKDEEYQRNVNQMELRLAPNTSWIVQTDHVSHAAMSGQHMFEQTFYLPPEAMCNPNLSPLKILEQLSGKCLLGN